MKAFPVQGGASYSPDYNPVAREGMRRHDGVDVFAPEGTPLVAVDDGFASFGTDPLGGNVVNLRAPDGARYYYAHLSSFEGGSRQVRAGEVIGRVGTTGNAAGKPPHVHFEVHPGIGGSSAYAYASLGPSGAVDPFPLLRDAPIVHRRGTRLPADASGETKVVAILAALAVGAYLWSRRAPARRGARA